jgi:hypothetical protein
MHAVRAAQGAAGGCRVIAFDRPPFGLTERPLEWGHDRTLAYSPYTLEGSGRLAEGALRAAVACCRCCCARCRCPCSTSTSAV